MRCLDDLDVLAYVEQRVPESQLAEIRAHLDGCTECLNLVAQLTGLRERAPIDGLTLGQTISSGGMGVVIEAFDHRLERRIALKVPRTDDPVAQQRFEREVKITARLQHPAIVPVYAAGSLGTGEPYYAMRLVEGETLDLAIGRAPTLAARLGLVRVVSAVAGAIAYAHAERIVHRDIKPANVLVGRFGEVVVIDWGLARLLDEAEPSGRAVTLTGSEPAGVVNTATATGAVLGTPAYMAPEQARGEPVDERADVYALGVMLAHVLRGTPPDGAAGGRGLAAIPELPRDLVAIVAQATAPEPADRYRSAAELAADLDRFLTGQLVGAHHYSVRQLIGRWLRRHRAAASVAALAAVIVIAVSAISVRRIVRSEATAVTERAVAVEHRAAAEDLLTFMLFDLRDKLVPIGKLDLLDGVARKARAYYQRFPGDGDPEQLRQRATAHQNLGDVLLGRGDKAGALAEYRAALALGAVLTAAYPRDADYQRDLAVTHDRLGEAMIKQGDLADGLREFRASQAITVRLAAAAPRDARLMQDVAISHTWIGGVLLDQGEIAGALVEYRAAVAVAQQLAAAEPGPDAQSMLSTAHGRLGDALLKQPDPAAALAEYRTALEIDAKLVASAPTNAPWLRHLAQAHGELGEVLRAQGDTAGALTEYRTSVAVDEKLVAIDPANAEWERDLEASRSRVGEMLLARGDAPGALVEFRASTATATKLAALEPANPLRQRDLSIAQDQLASALVATGAAREAVALHRASLAIVERLAAAAPDDADLQRDLMVGGVDLGDALLALHDPAAITAYRRSLVLGQQLVTSHPEADAAKGDLISVLGGLVKVLRALRGAQDAQAVTAAHQAVTTVGQLAAIAPDDAQWQGDLRKLRAELEALAAGRVP